MVTLIANVSDRVSEIPFFSFQAKAPHFKTTMRTVKEVNNEKTKVPDEPSFRSVSLVCFTPNLMNKLIQNRCTWKLIMKTTAAYVYIVEQLRQCFMF